MEVTSVGGKSSGAGLAASLLGVVPTAIDLRALLNCLKSILLSPVISIREETLPEPVLPHGDRLFSYSITT